MVLVDGLKLGTLISLSQLRRKYCQWGLLLDFCYDCLRCVIRVMRTSYPKRIQNRTYPKCIHNVFKTYPKCIHNARIHNIYKFRPPYPKRIHNVSKPYPKCIQRIRVSKKERIQKNVQDPLRRNLRCFCRMSVILDTRVF